MDEARAWLESNHTQNDLCTFLNHTSTKHEISGKVANKQGQLTWPRWVKRVRQNERHVRTCPQCSPLASYLSFLARWQHMLVQNIVQEDFACTAAEARCRLVDRVCNILYAGSHEDISSSTGYSCNITSKQSCTFSADNREGKVFCSSVWMREVASFGNKWEIKFTRVAKLAW